ncbi:hypothetical protein [Aestuariibacter salexigens]|uniref:hypothetical protein n=1 Tax=Aestuariibacter salexigens TaxID=226010 RepID=UPI0003FB6A4B|nr:hypothetical protein [Aestuariibacter salexigens]
MLTRFIGLLFLALVLPTALAQQSDDNILRLEATIRADKEQPKVLSIVPWQLPEHRSIKIQKPWSTDLTNAAMLERQAFLRALRSHQALYAREANTGEDNK